MNTNTFDQEEAKNQPIDTLPTDEREMIKAKPLQIFAGLNKTKLHIRSQRKVDRQAALGSKGFEEEKRASKTDDDLVLPEKKTKVLHLSVRNAVDLTKQKVSLIKKVPNNSKTPDGQD